MTASFPSQEAFPPADVAILGGGIIGLACAWELAERGRRVLVRDTAVLGRGASWAAAGMLAPAFEAASDPDTHPGLFDLCLASVGQWQAFAERLANASGREVGYVSGPALAVAETEEEIAVLQRIAVALGQSGVAHQHLSGHGLRTLDPALSATLKGGLSLPTDGQIDNRAVVDALVGVCQRHPQIALQARADAVDIDTLQEIYPDVVCAAGWQSASLVGDARAVMPVGGQMLATARTAASPNHTIRHGHVYIAPKSNRVVIGATVEPGEARPQVQPAQIDALKAHASRLCPGLATAPTIETWCGTRPGSPDNAPLIGESSRPRVWVATGHYRNGILLAPTTAQIIADLITGKTIDPLVEAFSPDRFTRTATDAPAV